MSFNTYDYQILTGHSAVCIIMLKYTYALGVFNRFKGLIPAI